MTETTAERDPHDIRVAINIGAPGADDGQIIWSLRKNANDLHKQGVLVRRPGLYRQDLKSKAEAASKTPPSDDDRRQFLQSMVKGQEMSRIVLSDNSYFGLPVWMLGGGQLFRNAARNISNLASLFYPGQVELFLSIQNPATLIPEVFAAQSSVDWKGFLRGADLGSLFWSDVIADISEALPDVPITVWAQEETPMIWPEVLGAVSGMPAEYPFLGANDVIGKVISAEGTARLEKYLAEHKFDAKHQAQVRATFLKYFCIEEALEEEIDLPGWSQALVDELTELYYDDFNRLHELKNVRIIEQI
ncbi:MAG: hypothetical protein CR993_04090 [Rhodobacterales bacterium]|nr:MAG: hypothetical protein CR993_04090 [Rhodobacterales bacterium]